MERTSLFAWILLLAASPLPAGRKPDFQALCYHDVQDRVCDPDGMAVSTANLVAQFQWLQAHGFHPVSVDDLLSAAGGKKELPPDPILITFDDGFRSFYTRVYPLLLRFRFPAVLSLVGKWMEVPPGGTVDYGGKPLPREAFVTWEEVREMTASGLVEIASHTYDLHKGVPANPQGNLQPALRARIYDPASGTYETDETYEGRIRRDLERNSSIILSRTGRRPRVVTWPYGKSSGPARRIARSLGMVVALSLKEEDPNSIDELGDIHRRLMYRNPSLEKFVWSIRHPHRLGPRRFLFLDLDLVFSVDPAVQEKRLGILLDRVKSLGVNRVCLKAWWDRDADGRPEALFFPNRVLPVRSDLLNRAAWQLWTRASVEVYVEMPGPSSFDLPFPKVQEIFEDLGKYADFSGLVLPGKENFGRTAALEACTRVHLPELFTARKFSRALPLPPGKKGSPSTSRLMEEENLLIFLLPGGRKPARLAGRPALPWGALPNLQEKILFVVDEEGEGPVFPSPSALDLLRFLQVVGIRNLGYAPRNFLGPDYVERSLRPLLSAEDFPFRR